MKIVLVSGIAWAMAQLIKLLLEWVRTKKLNLYAMFASGGMPSSHTSFVVSMAYFALATCFCLIVMYDAAGVRHAVGLQARMINLLVDQYNEQREVDVNRVKEILGHTPVQVFAGIILGIVVGYLGHANFY
jgi:acid phosphatase family membrane protein YuiD